ncbi:MAG: hypothetical protein C4530_18910 [Desulfobacteraceae bacterium]|nr:MAG: hypothetical protein C4530_18910 [Desulfobacteraceae bacterium]
MLCTTVRQGKECPFMTAKGCSYNGGICHEIVEKCNGCNRTVQVTASWYCSACPDPSLKWKNGNCNLASHIVTAVAANKTKVNPLKASKRASR